MTGKDHDIPTTPPTVLVTPDRVLPRTERERGSVTFGRAGGRLNGDWDGLTACASFRYSSGTVSYTTLLLILVVSEKARHAEVCCFLKGEI